MILYFWTALKDGGKPEPPSASVAMGITDDRGRAMRAGEETLGSGQASVVIIEAVRPGMAGPSLAPCYLRIGVGWRGHCTSGGEVTWDRFFVPGDPQAGHQAPGRMEP